MFGVKLAAIIKTTAMHCTRVHVRNFCMHKIAAPRCLRKKRTRKNVHANFQVFKPWIYKIYKTIYWYAFFHIYYLICKLVNQNLRSYGIVIYWVFHLRLGKKRKD